MYIITRKRGVGRRPQDSRTLYFVIYSSLLSSESDLSWEELGANQF